MDAACLTVELIAAGLVAPGAPGPLAPPPDPERRATGKARLMALARRRRAAAVLATAQRRWPVPRRESSAA